MNTGAIQRMFGTEVRRIRTQRGLSQEKLAFEAGLHRTYISQVEGGNRNISLINIYRLAAALGVKAKELLH